MKIKISKYSSSAIGMASILLITITIILFLKGSGDLPYALILLFPVFFFIFSIMIYFSLDNIEILDDVMIIKKIFSQKEIKLSNLHIYDISISKFPFLFMETTVGNFKINYTKHNYQQISDFLKRTNTVRFELFELTVKKCHLPPSDF